MRNNSRIGSLMETFSAPANNGSSIKKPASSKTSVLMESMGGMQYGRSRPAAMHESTVQDKEDIRVYLGQDTVLGEAKPQGKVQKLILDATELAAKTGDVASVNSLTRRREFIGIDFGRVMSAYQALEAKGLLTVEVERGVDTYLKLVEETIDEAKVEFKTDEDFVAYIEKNIPKALKEKADFSVELNKAALGGGRTVTVRYTSNDYKENPRLRNIEFNALFRLIFMIHQTPESPEAGADMRFEIVSGFSRQAKQFIKAPRMMKQKDFQGAADKLIKFFKDQEDELLDWSSNL